jgi:hypothetical protein
MAAYLTENPPARSQWFHRRNRPLTGCTVLHDAENIMDTVGPDTGAENVARFIRTRTGPGSYHDLVDSDSGIHLVEYVHGAFHDGTGSNNWALSLSFACRTVDWRRMSPAQRRGFLRQGALRFVAQQLWRQDVGAPLTRLRYITRAQSEAGESGFCCHGWRDPARRTDPGTRAPDLFPFDEFLDECKQALAQHMPHHPDAAPEDDMLPEQIKALERIDRALNEPNGGVLSLLEASRINQCVWEVSPATRQGPWPIDRLIGVDDKTGVIEQRLGEQAPADPEVAEGAAFTLDDDQLARVLVRPDVTGAIGEAFAAAMDRRARDRDPETGPAT